VVVLAALASSVFGQSSKPVVTASRPEITAAPPTASGEGNSALIIIQSAHMGPSLDPKFDTHIPTVVWPPSFTQNGSNRLLSLMTGLDWKGDDNDFSFRVRPEEHSPDLQAFESDNFLSLKARGYFSARQGFLNGTNVRPVSRPTGLPTTSFIGLLLALDSSNIIRPIPYSDVRQEPGMIVFEAESWEEQSEVSAAVLGRSLVLELPESKPISGPTATPDEILGHVYFRGIGWPQGWPIDPETGVPGLIRARNAVRLLQHPESFAWTINSPAHDTPAVWFGHVRGLTPTLLFTFSLVIVYVIGSAVYCIVVEHRGQLAAWVMVGIALAPADLLLSGRMDRAFGVEGWFWWFVAMVMTLGALSHWATQFFQRVFPGTHRLLGPAFIGLLACTLADPTWSAFSSVFTTSGNNLSAESIGAVAAYLCGVVAFSQPSNFREPVAEAAADPSLPRILEPVATEKASSALLRATKSQWFARIVAFVCLLVTASGLIWWSGDDWTYRTFPILAWLIGEGLFSAPLLLLWALLPHGPTPYGGVSDVWRHGAAGSPMGCIPDLAAYKALNISRYLDLLLNPGAMLFGLTAGTVGVVGDRFFVRQLRVLVFRDPRTRALPWLTLALAAAGILNPVILPACVIAGFGAMLSVFYTAVRAV
jgi:hypothetical protein